MANTMPPFAVESSFVRTIPVRPTDSWNAFAWARPNQLELAILNLAGLATHDPADQSPLLKELP